MKMTDCIQNMSLTMLLLSCVNSKSKTKTFHAEQRGLFGFGANTHMYLFSGPANQDVVKSLQVGSNNLTERVNNAFAPCIYYSESPVKLDFSKPETQIKAFMSGTTELVSKKGPTDLSDLKNQLKANGLADMVTRLENDQQAILGAIGSFTTTAMANTTISGALSTSIWKSALGAAVTSTTAAASAATGTVAVAAAGSTVAGAAAATTNVALTHSLMNLVPVCGPFSFVCTATIVAGIAFVTLKPAVDSAKTSLNNAPRVDDLIKIDQLKSALSNLSITREVEPRQMQLARKAVLESGPVPGLSCPTAMEVGTRLKDASSPNPPTVGTENPPAEPLQPNPNVQPSVTVTPEPSPGQDEPIQPNPGAN